MMEERHRRARLGMLPAVLAWLLLAPEGAWGGAEDGPALRLLFTGDVMGDYEPCDCREQPLGGIAQRAYLVGELRRDGGAAVLLDAGNLVTRGHVAVGPDAAAWRKVGAMVLVDAYSTMGVDAVNVGPLDLAFGLSYLQKLQRRAAFPWLSTNLVDPDTGAPLFTPVLTVERDGRRVAVLGLAPGGMEGAGYRSLDPVKAAARAAADARAAGADLVVVLSSLGQDDEKVLARKVREIDLILGCGDRSRTDPPRLVRGVPLVHPGTRGKYVVEVALGGGTGGDRFPVRFWPVERGAPVDETIEEMVREAAVRHDDPMFHEAGADAVP